MAGTNGEASTSVGASICSAVSVGGLIRLFDLQCRVVAHRDRSHLGGRASLSGHNGHGWSGGRPDPDANDPNRTFGTSFDHLVGDVEQIRLHIDAKHSRRFGALENAAGTRKLIGLVLRRAGQRTHDKLFA